MSTTLFDLGQLVSLSDCILPQPGTWGLKNALLEPIADVFSANHDRLHCLILQTPSLIYSAYLHSQIHTVAFIDTFGEPNPSAEKKTANPDLMNRFHERSAFLGTQHNACRVGDGPTVVKELEFGLNLFEGLIEAYKDTSEICRGVEAMVSSAIVLACTAVDVLCADLCLSVADVVDPVLKPKLEGKFARLVTTRESFEKVFGAGTVLTVLANKWVDALSQARHLLVHRAGITDAKYVKYRADKGILEMPDLKIGEPFPLTGGIAGPLIAKGIECGKKLVYTVDEWLWNKNHPTI